MTSTNPWSNFLPTLTWVLVPTLAIACASRTPGALTVLRAFILPPLVYLLCRTEVFGPNSALILVAVLTLGAISNGLVCPTSAA